MKRKAFASLLLLVLILLLAGCGCEHEWHAATCTAPKTCQLCGETEGEILPHTWQDATCAAPKTCTACKTTEGEPLPHTWQNPDCTTPKTCSVCKTTEGEALGHAWQDATCTTPMTCSVCQTTEGEPADHTWQDATCTTPKTCSVCKATEGKKGAHKWTGATCMAKGVCSVCGATGSKADHSYVVLNDIKPSKTFAGRRTLKCSTCEKQKKEYYTESYTYDLDAIAAKIAAYAKEKGFTPVIEYFDNYYKMTAYSVLDVERLRYGPDELVQKGKKTVDRIYSELTANGAILGNRAMHIHVYYTQSGAGGMGYFGVYYKVSFLDIE